MLTKNALEYISELGNRVKEYRVKLGISQKDLENKTGISIRTISRFEQGASIQLDAFIKILVSLGLGENLNLLIEDQSIRPSFYLNKNNVNNKRVRKKTQSKQVVVWGEDKK